MKRWISMFSLLLLCVNSFAESYVDVEGTLFPATTRVAGIELVLNGASVRKRGYYKGEAVGMYLPSQVDSVDAAMKMKGPKRIRLVILRDLDGSTISRYFINDFKQSASEAEFKLLINEVGQLGAMYANLHRVNKGDVVTVDWIPGKGMIPSLNGKALCAPLNSELMYEVTLRVGAGPNAPSEIREALLGQRPLHLVEAP